MNRDQIPCAMCARFTIAGHDEQAAKGNGYCEGFERYVRWDDRWCVLFKPAKDERKRQAWAAKHGMKNEAHAATKSEAAAVAAGAASKHITVE